MGNKSEYFYSSIIAIMPLVKLSNQATQDLGRFSDFLIQVGVPKKVEEVITAILDAFEVLESYQLFGKPYPMEGYADFHELTIPCGKSGYVALYSFDKKRDLVVIYAIRHQKEVGYTLK